MVEAQDPQIRYNPATAAVPATGDTLAKPEHMDTQAALRPTPNCFGTSVIAQMPKAAPVNAAVEADLPEDYDAIEALVLIMAEHLLPRLDQFAHSRARHALSIIEALNDGKKYPIATGTGTPIMESVNTTVDSDPIPGTSTTTKNPSVQPVNDAVPVSADVQAAPLVNNAAPQDESVSVAVSGPGSDVAE